MPSFAPHASKACDDRERDPAAIQRPFMCRLGAGSVDCAEPWEHTVPCIHRSLLSVCPSNLRRVERMHKLFSTRGGGGGLRANRSIYKSKPSHATRPDKKTTNVYVVYVARLGMLAGPDRQNRTRPDPTGPQKISKPTHKFDTRPKACSQSVRVQVVLRVMRTSGAGRDAPTQLVFSLHLRNSYEAA